MFHVSCILHLRIHHLEDPIASTAEPPGTSTRFDLGQKYCGVNNGTSALPPQTPPEAQLLVMGNGFLGKAWQRLGPFLFECVDPHCGGNRESPTGIREIFWQLFVSGPQVGDVQSYHILSVICGSIVKMDASVK